MANAQNLCYQACAKLKHYNLAPRWGIANTQTLCYQACANTGVIKVDWLKDVLERMHLYTTKNIGELLPQNWKKNYRIRFFY